MPSPERVLSIVIKRYAKPWATPIGLSERIHHIRVAQGHQQLTLGHTDVPQSALGAQCPWPKVWQSVWNVINSYSDISSTKVLEVPCRLRCRPPALVQTTFQGLVPV